MINVRDKGALGDVVYDASGTMISGTNDRAAFQAAFDEALTKSGEDIYIPPGNYYIEGQVTFLPLMNAFLQIRGDWGASVIVCKTTGVADAIFAIRSCWPSRITGLVFRAVAPSGTTAPDVAYIISDRSDHGIIELCNFYGIQASRAIVEGRDMIIDRCLFGGCRSWDPTLGIGYGVVSAVDFNRMAVVETDFTGYQYWRGINFSKPLGEAYLAFYDAARNASDGSTQPQPGAFRARGEVIRCNFDGNSKYEILQKPEGPGPNGMTMSPLCRLDSMLIDRCGFNASGGNVSHRAMKFKQIRDLTIKNSFVGWAAEERTILEMSDVEYAQLQHLNAVPSTLNPNFDPKVTADSLCGTIKMIECHGRDGKPLKIESAANRTMIEWQGLPYSMETI